MEFPNREKAYIPISKLRDYLLSETHLVGKAKARFWRAVGLDKTNMDVLRQSLIDIARHGEVREVTTSPYGTKYMVEGSIQTPLGKAVRVRTVWIIDRGQDRPRFVTAYPV